MERITLTANKRSVLGKKTDHLRSLGKLPGVLYGRDLSSQPVEISEKDFASAFKKAGESTLVNLVVDGESKPVIIHSVQHHYLSGQPIHVDFYAVRMDEKLHARIPLHFVGESSAVKTMGGVLVKNHHEVEVECLPADLPQFIEVDISALNNFEDLIRVSDLKVSDKVKILINPDEAVANVAPPRSEQELAELKEAPVAEDVTRVEGVIKPEATAEGKATEGKEDKKEAKTEEKPKEKAKE
ncbi:MAG: 50S ribosomal protein L25 [Candidatus Doudnabacteria bacterium]|nr:50S ribosomal protein L25 [Candidatus Doudnabacteria bacterium]